MEETTMGTPFERVLEELAEKRGLSGLEELVARINAADHGLPHVEGEVLTVERFLEWPPGGYGAAIERAVGLSEDERQRLVRAFVETYLR